MVGISLFLAIFASTLPKKLAYEIGTVFGQKEQLWMHLTPYDNFKFFGAIYDIDDQIVEKKIEVKENPFMGKTLCVTGKLFNFTRDSINTKIAELGAKTAGSVSKNTDYLITNEASGSSKYKKAIELSSGEKRALFEDDAKTIDNICFLLNFINSPPLLQLLYYEKIVMSIPLPEGQLHCAKGILHCVSTSFAEGNFIRLCPQERNEVELRLNEVIC